MYRLEVEEKQKSPPRGRAFPEAQNFTSGNLHHDDGGFQREGRRS